MKRTGYIENSYFLGYTFYENFSIQNLYKIFRNFIKFLRSTHIITNKNIKKIYIFYCIHNLFFIFFNFFYTKFKKSI